MKPKPLGQGAGRLDVGAFELELRVRGVVGAVGLELNNSRGEVRRHVSLSSPWYGA